MTELLTTIADKHKFLYTELMHYVDNHFSDYTYVPELTASDFTEMSEELQKGVVEAYIRDVSGIMVERNSFGYRLYNDRNGKVISSRTRSYTDVISGAMDALETNRDDTYNVQNLTF
jgi:hypothetical protein